VLPGLFNIMMYRGGLEYNRRTSLKRGMAKCYMDGDVERPKIDDSTWI